MCATSKGTPRPIVGQQRGQRVVGVVDPQRGVEQLAVEQAGEGAREGERDAPARGSDARQPGAHQADEAPAAICHGVHGPWPKKKFDASAADGADGEAGRGAEREAGEQDDVGGRLDVGDRREGDAARAPPARPASPRARAGATAGGCAPTRRSRRRGRRRGSAWTRRSQLMQAWTSVERAQQRGAGLRGPARRRRGCGRSAWRSTSRRRGPRRSARRRRPRPCRSGPCASATATASSASWVASTMPTPCALSAHSSVRQRGLARLVHPARRLVEQQRGGLLAADDDRDRQPLALAAGEVARMAVGQVREAGALSAAASSSSPTRSCRK